MVQSAIRHLFPASKNTQRLGSMMLITSLAQATRSVSTADLAREYSKLITGFVPVPSQDTTEMEVFLRRRNLLRKYKAIAHVEVQDWLLADPSLPSRTGSERGDTRAAVELATQLGVLYPETNRRTWLGDWFTAHTPDALASFRTGDRDRNVFGLNESIRLGGAWSVISRDADGIRYVVGQLVRADDPGGVSVTSLFSLVADSIDGYASDLKTRGVSEDDRRIVREIQAEARMLTRVGGNRRAAPGVVTQQTLRRRYEEFLYWRLETLVDLGLLRKRDKDGYSYDVTENTRAILDDRLATEEARRKAFFEWLSERHWPNRPEVSPNGVFQVLAEANRRCCNSMGYSLIQQGLLSANVLLLERGMRPSLDEVDFRAQLSKPPSGTRVLTSLDRNRHVSAFKVISE